MPDKKQASPGAGGKQRGHKPSDSLGSVLDEIGFYPLGRRILVPKGVPQKPLKVTLRKRSKPR